jgi:4-hydroxybenzoate polyprenyltransferase
MPKPSKLQLVRDSITIRRPEFILPELPIVLIPALLMATSLSALVTWQFVTALILIYLCFNFVDLINCLADRDLDATYKTRLSSAVYRLGVNNVRWQMTVTCGVAVVLAIVLAVDTGHWDLIPLVVVELVWSAQYSVGPMHFKSRGLWQVLTVWGIIFALPMAIVARAFPDELSWQLLLLFAGFGAMQEGIILINTAEDMPEDEEAGLRTSALVMGLSRTVAVAATMVAIGGAVCVVSLIAIGDPSWGLAVFALSISWVLWELVSTWLRVRGQPLDSGIAILRPRAGRVPLWLTVTAWGALFAAGFAFAQG